MRKARSQKARPHSSQTWKRRDPGNRRHPSAVADHSGKKRGRFDSASRIISMTAHALRQIRLVYDGAGPDARQDRDLISGRLLGGPWRHLDQTSELSTPKRGNRPESSLMPGTRARVERGDATWWRPGSSRRRKGGTGGRSGRGCGRRWWSGRTRSRPNQDVWLEITVDDVALGPLPAYWIENKGVNSLWHVPIPPQAVGVRLHYRSAARSPGRSWSPALRRTRSSGPTFPTARNRPRSSGRVPRGWSATG